MKSNPAIRLSLVWLVVVALLVSILAFRLHLSFDLGAFLPRNGGTSAQVLLQQLGDGPGSRIMVLGISGGTQPQRLEASRALQAGLSEQAYFVQVLNGEAGPASDAVPEPIRSRYPLMQDLDYQPEALGEAIQQRLQDLALGGGTALAELMTADPYLASLDLLQQLAAGEAGADLWQAANGSAVLLAETRASGTDLVAQADALAAVQQYFDDYISEEGLSAEPPLGSEPGLVLDVTGVGPFGVELQQSIQAEATLRSVLASVAVVLVLLLLFRSPRLLLLVVLPVGLGFLAGLTAVSLVFGEVHGITLAFGVTLLGVAVDFPLHLFTHQKIDSARVSMSGFWRTLWLGACSTALAYLAMLFSGANGLAQLGLFSAVGVMMAAWVTHSWLPALMPSGIAPSATRSLPSAPQPEPTEPVSAPGSGPGKSAARLHWPLAGLSLVLALCFLLFVKQGTHWDDRLAALSPVNPDRIELDSQLRSASASFSMRYQIRLEAESLEALLQGCEQLQTRLSAAKQEGLLSDWSAVCSLLPSGQQQNRRLALIPKPSDMQARLQAALVDSAFNPAAFKPFEQTLQAVRDNFPITPADFDSGPLAAWMAAHLLQVEDRWFALVNLADPQAEELAAQVATWGPGLAWVDLQQASEHMMHDFRNEASRAVVAAALAILLMLVIARTAPRRLLWIMLTASASLALTVAAIIALEGAINLVHLVALLLVLGLGLDYSLFLSRTDEDADIHLARRAILACALSTTLAFGILAGSSIPMLRYIGMTVAIGSLTAYLLAVLGSRQQKAG